MSNFLSYLTSVKEFPLRYKESIQQGISYNDYAACAHSPFHENGAQYQPNFDDKWLMDC